MPIRTPPKTTQMKSLPTLVSTTYYLLVTSMMDGCYSLAWGFASESSLVTLYSSEGPHSLIKPGDGEVKEGLSWFLLLTTTYSLWNMWGESGTPLPYLVINMAKQEGSAQQRFYLH